VVRHDRDDPYLVVAADKGIATFSDIANAAALREDLRAVHSVLTAAVVQSSPQGSRGKDDVHRWVDWIDAARSAVCACSGTLSRAAVSNVATMSVALLEIRSSRPRTPRSPIPGNDDNMTEPGILDGR
jgi:NAD-specific glutamate dehydrogenase